MVEGQDVETEIGHFYGFYYGFILLVLGELFFNIIYSIIILYCTCILKAKQDISVF